MKINYLGGRGEPLLMIHGWGVNSEIWISLVDKLKFFASVYVVDLPGMGGSSSISPYTLDNIAKEIIDTNHMPFIRHKKEMTESVKKFLQNDK